MTKDERERFERIEGDLSFLKDTLSLLMNNHLPHLQQAIDDVGDKSEQAWLMAEEAERQSKRTEKFVVGGVTFLGIIIAIITCLA